MSNFQRKLSRGNYKQKEGSNQYTLQSVLAQSAPNSPEIKTNHTDLARVQGKNLEDKTHLSSVFF